MSVRENLGHVREQLSAACNRAGRNPEDVRLVAIAKTKPVDVVREALSAGQTVIGESYVQEFVDKAEAIRESVEWHFVGALQTNKVKYLAGKVALIHSVDRLHLAEEIDRQWAKIGQAVDILIQLNLGHEVTKSGADEEELEKLVREIAQLEHVKIKGLMTLPPYLDDPEDVRPFFRHLRELARYIDGLGIAGVEMRELSMGMTHDFEVAIEEGATLIRVGTAIFGARRPKR
ncbi:MAG: YggS family pyridoxal phosphate-dependent enzyme [Deltaproteobacteria bacterium]|nr:YggS family pyridoxal phosphate-dependent enzyme [Deltaproteobacteria bacterium]